ncbi:uncharacterized protein LOC131636901 [Vicia villosa]|uniref:uncharacterized protein LOC131636901 n=1 Tax=Vicia villosa TaxID=3911 RepID=UPI00273B854B|nr:uncharacterized protein LOC131636901 [Vicia villosa]
MVENGEQIRSPVIRKKAALMESNSQNMASFISPRFKSAAAMAGWDEEALMLAALIVEDTPDRDSKQKKRLVLNSKSPLSNSSRKRRALRNPQPIVLDLDEDETPKKDSGKKKREKKNCVGEESKVGEKELTKKGSDVNSNSSGLPCMDKLREELSCAICLEICFEPSTTPCGHSFCRKCLKSAGDKCGKKCPKCRQLISNGRSCTVNTVLWNTIQLLFPQEIEARKVAAASTINNRHAVQNPIPEKTFYTSTRNRSLQPYPSSRGMNSRRNEAATTQDEEDAALARRLQREIDRENNNRRTSTLSSMVRARSRRGVSNQDEDAAFALRLQRNEFMQAFRSSSQEPSSSSSSTLLAGPNLRAMATRAMNLRNRERRV